MIEEHERRRMLRAYSIGPRMIAYLEEIGVERLDDLVDADPHEIAMRIEIALGTQAPQPVRHRGAAEPGRIGAQGVRTGKWVASRA